MVVEYFPTPLNPVWPGSGLVPIPDGLVPIQEGLMPI